MSWIYVSYKYFLLMYLIEFIKYLIEVYQHLNI